MITFRYHVVGLLLLFIYTAQSFVMLTANMEDIKKIARKFVSDSVADRIAEFVVKATEQMTNQVTNVSEENELNLRDISDDNDHYKQSFAHTEQTTKDSGRYEREDNNDNRSRDKNKENRNNYSKPQLDSHKEPKYNTNMNHGAKMSLDSKQKKWPNDKDNKDLSAERHSIERYKNNYNEVHDKKQSYYHPGSDLQSLRDRPMTYNQNNENNNEDKTQKKVESFEHNEVKATERFRIVGSKKLDESYDSGERRPSNLNNKNLKAREQNSLSVEEIDDSKSDRIKKSYREFEKVAKSVKMEITTEKQHNDFDQYDNPYYPKSANFIATSGPVMLPKMSQEHKRWWEKDMLSSEKA